MKTNRESGSNSENDSSSSETDSIDDQNGGASPSYFSSYEDLDVHRLMLEDCVRTESYRKAILENQSLFEGKIVMDVGAGTGILSLFAAKAGAKKVYAVEASSIALIARNIVKQNNLQDVIEVFSCQLEDFLLPNSEKVDVVISEWMGFYLLHESMLSSVIFARNKFLKESGFMFPYIALLYACPSNLHGFYVKEIQFWDDVYGFDFSVAKPLALQSKQKSPQIMLVESDELLAKPELVKKFDLMSVTIADIKTLQMRYFTSSTQANVCRGIVLWFDCEFPAFNSQRNILSTAPYSPPTHWKQTVIVLPGEINLDEGDVIGFSIELTQSIEDRRHYNIKVEVLGNDEEHPVPCNCGLARCTLIKAFLQEQEAEGIDETEGVIDISL